MKKKVSSPYGFIYTWELINLDKAKAIITTFENKELVAFKPLYSCSNTKSYLLGDERVIAINDHDAMIYSSFKGYISDLQTSGLLNDKKLINQQLPVKKIEYLSNNEKIFYYQIPNIQGEASAILFKKIDKKNNYSKIASTVAYETQHREIIEHNISKNIYFLFLNFDDYQKYTFKQFQLSTSFHNYSNNIGSSPKGCFIPLMCGRNPFGKNFINNIDNLIQELPRLLLAPSKIFTFKIDSIPAIEKFLYRNYITDDFTDNVFLPLLAYIGQSFIKNEGGKWEMLHDEICDTWIPDVLSNGKPKELYFPLLKILDSSDDQWHPLFTVYRHRE